MNEHYFLQFNTLAPVFHPVNVVRKECSCIPLIIYHIQLRKHKNLVHTDSKNGPELPSCEKCGFKTHDQIMMNKHMIEYHTKKRFKCKSCDYLGESESELEKHNEVHQTQIPNQRYPCDECELITPRINDLVEHKRTVHGVLRYACDICSHTDGLLEGLWRHKIDSHQSYGLNDAEGTFQMQQMLLISLSAQVEFLVQSMSRLNVEIVQGFEENKTQIHTLKDNMKKTESKVDDLGVALAKTSRFDTKIQNDSLAVLTKVTEKCSTIENIVAIGMKANRAVDDQKRAKPGNHIKNAAEDKPSKKATNDKNDAQKVRKDSVKSSDTQRKHQVTWVGTSISKVLEKGKLEQDLNVKLNAIRAYCVNEEGKFPESNFNAIVPTIVGKGETDTLILETGSIEITNMDVNKALMDPHKEINEYKREWFEKAEEVSTELFRIAEDAIAADERLNVIILKRLPRFDRSSNDLINIKSNLSEFANQIYDQLWLRKGCPKRIQIVKIKMAENGYLKDLIFGTPDNSQYDGIHLAGSGASRQFSYQTIKALKPFFAKPNIVPAKPVFSRRKQNGNTQFGAEDNHQNCAQAVYMRQSSGSRLRGRTGQGKLYSEVLKGSSQEKKDFAYSVPTKNFFNTLNY